jgi:hypothetical protein
MKGHSYYKSRKVGEISGRQRNSPGSFVEKKQSTAQQLRLYLWPELVKAA